LFPAARRPFGASTRVNRQPRHPFKNTHDDFGQPRQHFLKRVSLE
jgi:hypothetical protein